MTSIACIRCRRAIEYHAYRDVARIPWRHFRRGESIGPMCLGCYCKLHAANVFSPSRKTNGVPVGHIIASLMVKLHVGNAGISHILGVHESSVSEWRRNRKRPCRAMYEQIIELAERYGIKAVTNER
jgi:hypothetical protein